MQKQNLNGFCKDRYIVLEDTITVWYDFASDQSNFSHESDDMTTKWKDQ